MGACICLEINVMLLRLFWGSLWVFLVLVGATWGLFRCSWGDSMARRNSKTVFWAPLSPHIGPRGILHSLNTAPGALIDLEAFCAFIDSDSSEAPIIIQSH